MSAIGTDLKTTKKSGHSNSIPGCYSDRRTARTWASAVMKRNSLTKLKITSSIPDLSLIVDGASTPIFGDRKKLTQLKMEEFKVLYDWLQARGVSCELNVKLKS